MIKTGEELRASPHREFVIYVRYHLKYDDDIAEGVKKVLEEALKRIEDLNVSMQHYKGLANANHPSQP
jgi:hypothetical protein